MILKFLGALDLFAIITIIFSFMLPKSVILYGAGWLILKGVLFGFTGEITSWIDAVCGIYAMLLAYGIGNNLVTVVVIIYLLQKAVVSFL